MGWKPSPDLVYALAAPWTGSWRFHRYGTQHLVEAVRMSPTRTVVVLLWHHSLMNMVGAFPRHGHMRLAALASRSGDGAIIAEYLERIGIRAVRGSSARGAAAGAKAVLEALRGGYHVAIACDGPRGPARQPKGGALEIARLCGVPVLPLAARATREIRFRSWDRFRLPWPRAHVAYGFAPPILFPPGEPDAAELERRRQQVAAAIDGTEASLALRAGQRDRWPVGGVLDWRLHPPG
jgi:lysophospholipid acyltransferase (LPLAT)-like uncharacterized protein